MDDQLLLKQFNADPGAAFADVIRLEGAPIDARKIHQRIVSAGARLDDVRAKWERMRPYLKSHPNVGKPERTKYEWNLEPIRSAEALRRLSELIGKRTAPAWLIRAFVETVQDSLAAAEMSGPRAESSWSEERDLQKAQVLAEALSEVELLAADGAAGAEIVDALLRQADYYRLSRILQVGDEIPHDPVEYDVRGSTPRQGEPVRVLSSGYQWVYGNREDVVVRPVVAGRGAAT